MIWIVPGLAVAVLLWLLLRRGREAGPQGRAQAGGDSYVAEPGSYGTPTPAVTPEYATWSADPAPDNNACAPDSGGWDGGGGGGCDSGGGDSGGGDSGGGGGGD